MTVPRRVFARFVGVLFVGGLFVGGLFAAGLLGGGCEKPTGHRADDSLSNLESDEGAARPVSPRSVRTHFNIDCFDVYAECKAVKGLPAVSADGARIAVADTSDESARDEFVLTLLYLDSASGDVVERMPIMTLEDRASGLDPNTEAMSPTLRATLEARVVKADQELARGGFQPMLFLGVVDGERPGEPVSGLVATFTGKDVRVTEGATELWRRPVGPVLTAAGSAGCVSDQIAELRVWVRRKPAALLARVSFTTAHMCDVSSQYQAWR